MTTDEFKAWRKAMGFRSQQRAAETLDLSKATIESYESGRWRDTGKPAIIPHIVELACASLAVDLASRSTAVAGNAIATSAETEKLRRKLVAELGKPEATMRAEFAPGSLGCHEAMHMASFLMQSVKGELLSHPAIATRPEWFAIANAVFDTLNRLYQEIAAA